jgi:hypothetical protein
MGVLMPRGANQRSLIDNDTAVNSEKTLLSTFALVS